MSMRIWIDHLSQRALGSRRVVRAKLFQFMRDACSKLGEVGLKASPTSVLMCSGPAGGIFVSRELRRAGACVSAVRQALYLGVGLGSGRPARQVRCKRQAKARAMTAKIR
eukprot:6558667-Pyramimonas_sp.AAC.1